MDLSKLFTLQSVLDHHILESQEIPEDRNLIEDKKDALEVEICELQNEVKYFKFWKTPETRQINREAALEEYVDGLHFFLSLGNDYAVPDTFIHREVPVKNGLKNGKGDIRNQFRMIKQYVFIMDGPMHWYIAFGLYLGLGEMLGFSDEEIERKYLEKNAVNHQRQSEGY